MHVRHYKEPNIFQLIENPYFLLAIFVTICLVHMFQINLFDIKGQFKTVFMILRNNKNMIIRCVLKE